MSHCALVVEEDAAGRLLLRELLEHRGWQVVEAVDVPTAMAHLSPDMDLVLLDVELPGGGGEVVLRHVRVDGGLDGIVVAAVTAHAMPGDRERLLSTGFDAYFSKPICPRTLVTDLEALLR